MSWTRLKYIQQIANFPAHNRTRFYTPKTRSSVFPLPYWLLRKKSLDVGIEHMASVYDYIRTEENTETENECTLQGVKKVGGFKYRLPADICPCRLNKTTNLSSWFFSPCIPSRHVFWYSVSLGHTSVCSRVALSLGGWSQLADADTRYLSATATRVAGSLFNSVIWLTLTG